MVLRLWIGDRYDGSAPLISNLLVAYEAYQGLVPGRSSYTDTDESVVMLTLYSSMPRREAITTIYKALGMTRSRYIEPGTSRTVP